MIKQKLTKEQSAIIGLYTGVCCGNFSNIQEYAEKLYGHPIFTHQFADEKLVEKLKELAKPDFLAICYDGE